jgi:hypothetical protein
MIKHFLKNRSSCTRLSVTLGALEARKGRKEDARPYTRTPQSELVNRIRRCDAHPFAAHLRGDVCLCVEASATGAHCATSCRDVCTDHRSRKIRTPPTRGRSNLSSS